MKNMSFVDGINSKTGIRCGVIPADKVPCLYREIVFNGNSITYRQYVDSLEDRLRYILTEEEGMKELLEDYCLDEEIQDEILQWVAENNPKEENIEELSTMIVEELHCLEFDQEEYEYQTEDGEQYSLNYLEGEPMIWVIHTQFLTKTKLFSSSDIHSAGDLNSPDPEGGYTCYAIEPEYFEGECPYEVCLVPKHS